MNVKRGMVGSVRRILAVAVFGAVALATTAAMASVPVTVTQQGQLVDDGEPMTGEQDLEFGLYDAATDGNLLWSDEIATDLGDNGVYTATLGGDDNPIDATVLQDGEVYLQLTVDGETFDPRVELTSVPFATIAQTAEVAESVVDGGVTAEAIADGAVGSEAVDSISWDDVTDVPSEVTESSDTLAELSCGDEQVAVYDGSQWVCGDETTYSGEDFALSSQNCGDGLVAEGVDSDGMLNCIEQDDTTYSGEDFALSGESCSGDRVAAGINTDGTLNCIDQQDTTYSGHDFAISDQGCSGDRVAAGIDADGTLNCIDQQDTTYSAGTGLDLSGQEFSADTGYFDGNYLPAGQSIHVEGDVDADGDIEADGQLRANADESSSLSYLRFRQDGPRLYHSEISDMFAFRDAAEMDLGTSTTEMDLDVSGDGEFDGDLDVGEDLLFDTDFAGISKTESVGNLSFRQSAYDYEQVYFHPDVHIAGDFSVGGDKNFVQPHSDDPGKQVNYIAQESGESTVSWRGSETIGQEQAVVELPDHFREVASDDEELTTTVTPQGEWAPLYVESKSPRQVVVAVADGFDDIGDVEFDIHVQGVRAGREHAGGIVENSDFTPEAYGVDDNLELVEEPAPHIEARMIENGTLNADGTVNVETAREQGWELDER